MLSLFPKKSSVYLVRPIVAACFGYGARNEQFNCKILHGFMSTQGFRFSKNDSHVVLTKDSLFHEVDDCKKRISVLEQDRQDLQKSITNPDMYKANLKEDLFIAGGIATAILCTWVPTDHKQVE